MHRTIWFFTLIMVLLVTVMLSHAAEINKRPRLAPDAQVKVNRALAKSYAADSLGGAPKASGEGQQDGCGNTKIGTLTETRGTRVDNITVVRGDVITVSRNVRCP